MSIKLHLEDDVINNEIKHSYLLAHLKWLISGLCSYAMLIIVYDIGTRGTYIAMNYLITSARPGKLDHSVAHVKKQRQL